MSLLDPVAGSVNKTGRTTRTIGWLGLLALLLWGQLVFGAVMSWWRYYLILFEGWQAYPSGVPAEYDQFIQFAAQSTPADSSVIFLSPPGDKYHARFVRLQYFLYPRRIYWLATGPRTSPSNWTETDLSATDLTRWVTGKQIYAVLVDDISTVVPLAGERLKFDSASYILIPQH